MKIHLKPCINNRKFQSDPFGCQVCLTIVFKIPLAQIRYSNKMNILCVTLIHFILFPVTWLSVSRDAGSYSGQGGPVVIKRAHLFRKGHIKKMKMHLKTYDVI